MANEFQTYQLLIYIRKPARIRVGALGLCDFSEGYYIYTGSAKRNLDQRVARHCRRRKTKRWHIDYLTTHRDAKVIATRKSTLCECFLNQKVNGKIIVPGLGASDCKSGCGSHLSYVGVDTPDDF